MLFQNHRQLQFMIFKGQKLLKPWHKKKTKYVWCKGVILHWLDAQQHHTWPSIFGLVWYYPRHRHNHFVFPWGLVELGSPQQLQCVVIYIYIVSMIFHTACTILPKWHLWSVKWPDHWIYHSLLWYFSAVVLTGTLCCPWND